MRRGLRRIVWQNRQRLKNRLLGKCLSDRYLFPYTIDHYPRVGGRAFVRTQMCAMAGSVSRRRIATLPLIPLGGECRRARTRSPPHCSHARPPALGGRPQQLRCSSQRRLARRPGRLGSSGPDARGSRGRTAALTAAFASVAGAGSPSPRSGRGLRLTPGRGSRPPAATGRESRPREPRPPADTARLSRPPTRGGSSGTPAAGSS